MSAAPWSAGEDDARLAIPPDSIDCHLHIYDHRFPYVEGVRLQPPPATIADYEKLQRRLGLKRCVVVQPSSYGSDNTCLLDALAHFGNDARGVVVIDEQTSDDELEKLDKAGVRGIRFNLSRPAGAGVELIERLCARIAPLGWHAQLHTLGSGYLTLEKILARLPVPVVIDHLGRVSPSGAIEQRDAFAALCRLVDNGRTWMKVSGAYHDSLVGAPIYSDTGRMVSAWTKIAPERVLWGTDWPHPSAMVGEKPMPDDALLLDLFGEWCADESLLRAILVDNPNELYGFKAGRSQP